MNPIASHLIDGLLVLEVLVGATITGAGADYPCVGGAETISKALDLGGMNIIADADIVVRNAVFPAGGWLPAEKNKIRFSSAAGVASRSYRIDGITYLHGAIMVLHCNQDSKGG